MLWFLLSVLGFAVLTAAVIGLARGDTARWERETALRARTPVGSTPLHARRRRIEMSPGVPAPRVPVTDDALDGPAAAEAS